MRAFLLPPFPALELTSHYASHIPRSLDRESAAQAAAEGASPENSQATGPVEERAEARDKHDAEAADQLWRAALDEPTEGAGGDEPLSLRYRGQRGANCMRAQAVCRNPIHLSEDLTP